MLRTLLRCALASARGEPCGGCPDDPASIALAIDIHGIGAALGGCARGCTPPALAAVRQANAARQDAHRSTLSAFAAIAHNSGIEWCVLNGLPQADLLYADPALRAAGPIDVLLAPGTVAAAQNVFRREGWQAARVVGGDHRALGLAGLRADPVRLLLQPATRQRVHLHERLFFGGGRIGTLLRAEQAIRPRRSTTPDDVPALALSVPLVLDILLRGHSRQWSRLKWLVDLDLALRRLEPPGHVALLDAIAFAGIAPLATAGFAMLRGMTDQPLPEAIDAWVVARQDSDEAAYRHRVCRDALAAAQPVPPPHDDIDVTPQRFAMLQSARDRLKRGIAYRAARAVHAMARSTVAGWSRRRGQHQRHPATRPDRYPMAFGFAAEQLGRDSELNIMSFGCSTGDEVFTLRHYFDQAQIKGIEVDPRRVAICRERLAATPDPGLTFACTDSVAGEPDGHYDAIFVMAVFRDARLDGPEVARATGYLSFAQFQHHIVDFVRVLKPGGLLFVGASNFRVRDTVAARRLEPVLHDDPARSGIVPGLFDRDDRRLVGIEDHALGFRKLRGGPGIA